MSNHLENTVLAKVFTNTNFTVSNIYIKLHTGNPGEAGLNNAATETTREEVTFDAPVGNTITASDVVTWTSVAAGETYTYISLWDDVSAGNCLWIGALDASATVLAGQNFEIDSLTISMD